MDNFDGDASYWLHYHFLCVVSEEINKKICREVLFYVCELP
jgi:hypothetical protein